VLVSIMSDKEFGGVEKRLKLAQKRSLTLDRE
jgi:hypothetical protein